MVSIKIELHMAALRNFQRIIQGLWNVPEEHFHFIATFHVKFIAEKLHAIQIASLSAGGNAHLNIMSLCIVCIDVVKVIRTDKTYSILFCHFH